jgi:hypothetical protein
MKTVSALKRTTICYSSSEALKAPRNCVWSILFSEEALCQKSMPRSLRLHINTALLGTSRKHRLQEHRISCRLPGLNWRWEWYSQSCCVLSLSLKIQAQSSISDKLSYCYLLWGTGVELWGPPLVCSQRGSLWTQISSAISFNVPDTDVIHFLGLLVVCF